jgi:hypothetical protein
MDPKMHSGRREVYGEQVAEDQRGKRNVPLGESFVVELKAFRSLPIHWIKEFPGSRRVTLWKGTKQERSVLLLSERPGGQLIEKHLDAVGFEDWPVIMRSIALDDRETIDKHEMNCIWTFPQLNERLFLCRILGQRVDPEKDITFDRPVRPEYRTYVDMLACHGIPEDWGYVVPPRKASPKKKVGSLRK